MSPPPRTASQNLLRGRGKHMDHGGILRQRKGVFAAKSQPMVGPRQPDGEIGDFSMPPALDLCISSTETAGWTCQTHGSIAPSSTGTQREMLTQGANGFVFSSPVTTALMWAVQFSKAVGSCAPVRGLPEKTKLPLPRNFIYQLSDVE